MAKSLSKNDSQQPTPEEDKEVVVATWNLQGSKHSTDCNWQVTIRALSRRYHHASRVFCLQEAGSRPRSSGVLQRNLANDPNFSLSVWPRRSVVTRSQRSCVRLYISYYHCDHGGNRCNLAIVTNARPVEWRVFPPIDRAYRPAIAARVGTRWFISFHALSNGGRDVDRMMEAIFLGLGQQTVYVMGDFNRAPRNLPNFRLLAPPTPTHPVRPSPRNTLDYIYTNANEATNQGQVLNTANSDHCAYVRSILPHPMP